MSAEQKIVKNIGWWGFSPAGTSLDDFTGLIVWPKRDPKNPVPEVGDTIVDTQNGKGVGFTVLSVDENVQDMGEDSYLKVKADGWYYDEE